MIELISSSMSCCCDAFCMFSLRLLSLPESELLRLMPSLAAIASPAYGVDS